MIETICVDPETTVYGTMGMYGIHQKQKEFILSAKMAVIRACSNGYITPDAAASQIIQLQNSKPFSVEDGEKMSKQLSSGLMAVNEAIRQQHEAQMELDRQKGKKNGGV